MTCVQRLFPYAAHVRFRVISISAWGRTATDDNQAARVQSPRSQTGQKWTVPLGGGIGKIFHFWKLPVNTQVSAYYNVVRPDYQANWQIRAQMQFMFPK